MLTLLSIPIDQGFWFLLQTIFFKLPQSLSTPPSKMAFEVPSSLPDSKHVLASKIEAKDGKTDELKQMLLQIRDHATSGAEPGTLRYERSVS